jgi:hypothetical protein
MNIETFFDLNEELFFLDKNNKIQRKPTYRIDITVNSTGVKTQCWFNTAPEGKTYEFIILNEDQVFSTKEELIQSLES